MKKFYHTMKKSVKVAAMTAVCTLFFAVTAFAAADGQEEKGPGVTGTETATTTAAETPQEGTSLGIFTTTGYCNCRKCSGGSGLTYSGTTPKAGHTLSADISILPIGTRVRINDTIYTVEDIGSGVDGHKVDIYYDTHEEAWNHGMKQEEVFLIGYPEDETGKETKAATETKQTEKPTETKAAGTKAAADTDTSDALTGPGVEA